MHVQDGCAKQFHSVPGLPQIVPGYPQTVPGLPQIVPGSPQIVPGLPYTLPLNFTQFREIPGETSV